MAGTCLCGAAILITDIPNRNERICSRTRSAPCDAVPLPAVPLTFDDLRNERAMRWTEFMDAQDNLTRKAAAYADVCFRSAQAPRSGALPQADGAS